MKVVTPFLLLFALTIAGCDKSEAEKTEPSFSVTDAVKTGNWMVLYFENNASVDIGVPFLKFNVAGSLVATIDGTPYNGTWTEANTSGNNTLTLNITTTNIKLKKVNGTWKVTGVSEQFIDLKDTSAASKTTMQLMKH